MRDEVTAEKREGKYFIQYWSDPDRTATCAEHEAKHLGATLAAAIVRRDEEIERLTRELALREEEVFCVRNSQSIELANAKDEIERLTRELEGVNTSVCHRCGKKVFVIQNNVVCQCATGGE